MNGEPGETFERVTNGGDAQEADEAISVDDDIFPASEDVEPVSTLDLLAQVNLFANLPPVFLRRIEALGEIETWKRNDLIFAEGSLGDRVYLILEGKVRISRSVPGIGEEALAILTAGDYFGEMALIDEFPRSADARAHEPCRLFVISKDHLSDLLFVDRDLAYDLLWNFVRTLCGRLRESNDKMTMLAVSSRF